MKKALKANISQVTLPSCTTNSSIKLKQKKIKRQAKQNIGTVARKTRQDFSDVVA